MDIYVKFYHDHSPSMVMSRDPGYKFEKFYFSPNSMLNFKKSYQVWRKLLQAKHKTRGGKQPPPPSQ